MKINKRGADILRILAFKEGYVTYGELAEKLGVSSKTIAREVSNLESLFTTPNVKLIRKSGVGVKLKIEDEDGKKIINSLIKQENIEYSSQERQSIILTYLLKTQEPVKQYVFSSMLKVTDTTIANDLSKIEDKLNKYNIELIRKSGLGVYIKGNEVDIRKAIINHIYDNVGTDFTLDFFYSSNRVKINDIAKNFLYDLVNPLVISKVEYAINLITEQEEYILEENSYTGLVIHLTLSIQRLLNEEGVIEVNPIVESYFNTKEYKIALALSSLLGTIFQLEVPKSETGYIVLHLLGARNSYQNTEVIQFEQLKLTVLAKEIINEAIGIYGKNIIEKKRLIVDLVKHLGPAINRLKLDMEIRNPLLSQLEENYPDLMEVAEKACLPLKKYLDINNVPRDEIGFIAMHLGAAFQLGQVNSKIKALVACPMGIGTSRFLAYQLKKRYPQLEIIGIISTKDRENVLLDMADVILTTVEIEYEKLPVYQVSYILSESDCKGLDFLLKTIYKSNKEEIDHKKVVNKSLKRGIQDFKLYLDGIDEIISTIKYFKLFSNINVEYLARFLSDNVFKNDNPIQLYEDFIKREESGSTIFNGIMIFHTRSIVVKKMQLSIIVLDKPMVLTDGSIITTIVAMIAPKDYESLKIEILSYFSQIIIEYEEVIEVLKFGNKEKILLEIEKYYKQYLKNKFNELMEE